MSQIFYGGRTPKPHRHSWGPKVGEGRMWALGIAHEWPEVTQVCVTCGKLKDEAVSRRGLNNRKRGNAIERWVCALLGIRRVGQYGGKEDGGSSEDFLVVQVKSGGAFQAALLSKIHTVPSRGDQLRGWVTASTPGAGAKREGVISFDLEEFARWYGKGTAE